MTVSTSTRINSQAYIESLKEALKDAACVLDLANAELAAAQSAYDNANSWKGLLVEYWSRVKATDDLATELKGSITRVFNHAGKVGDNTIEGNKAILLLVNAVKLMSNCGDTLKNELQELKFKIDCLDNSDLDSKKGILKCLNELNDATTVAQTAACLAIETTLDSLEESAYLRYFINGSDGLKENITAIGKNLSSGSKDGLRDAELKIRDTKPVFPLSHPDCDYYDYLKKQAQDEGGNKGVAVAACITAKAELDDKKDVKDSAQAKYDAVEAALNAALSAKKC